MQPQPCAELDRLLGKAQDKDPLAAAFDEAGQQLTAARRCYANLKGTEAVKGTVSIRVSPQRSEVVVGESVSATASVSPEARGVRVLLPVDRQQPGIGQQREHARNDDQQGRQPHHQGRGIQGSGQPGAKDR